MEREQEHRRNEGKRVAVYARVSTTDQSCEAQLRDLREYVAARRWQATEYLDQGVSGAKDRRPGLDRLLAAVKARKVDVVVVAAFDRFSRSVRHLVECLELFRHYGVEFVSLRESIDTGSPLGQAVFTIIAAIAQLERSLIAERVRAGLRRAKADGKQLGRPRVEVDQCGSRACGAGGCRCGRPHANSASPRRPSRDSCEVTVASRLRITVSEYRSDRRYGPHSAPIRGRMPL